MYVNSPWRLTVGVKLSETSTHDFEKLCYIELHTDEKVFYVLKRLRADLKGKTLSERIAEEEAIVRQRVSAKL
jgi:hypothetical protein